ncbi:MAG TPA: DUF4446 family protein [Trebonia sp.]|nr:DUF4446 family protein [Trebonia sp.]
MISVVLSVVAVVVAAVGLWVATGVQGRSASGKPKAPEGAPPAQGDDPGTIDLRALRDVAVIRYDALQEMSGQLSFSLALLNSSGDGIVLSSINGRAETRTYAKIVMAGRGEQQLSPEEEEAIRVARLGLGLGASAPPSGRSGTRPEALQA